MGCGPRSYGEKYYLCTKFAITVRPRIFCKQICYGYCTFSESQILAYYTPKKDQHECVLLFVF